MNQQNIKRKASKDSWSKVLNEQQYGKWQYGLKWYKNLLKVKKQKLVEHRKKCKTGKTKNA